MSKRKQAINNRRVGKRGEQGAKMLLEAYGWYIADNQIQGLAGDDLFARDPDGKWWSVEVKNTQCLEDKFIHQAREQAQERRSKITRHSKKSQLNREVMQFLGMTEFNMNNWLVLWHPRNVRSRSRMWVGVVRDNEGYTHYMAPFDGTVDTSFKEVDAYANPCDSEGTLPEDDGLDGCCGGAEDGCECEPEGCCDGTEGLDD